MPPTCYRTMPESGDPTEHLRSFSRARENDRTARTNKIAEGSVAAYTGPMAKLPREVRTATVNSN